MLKLLFCVLLMVILSHPSSTYADNKNVLKQVPAGLGYTPKEGFLPTKDVALAVAEVLLTEVYGKDAVQAQKPFSATLSENVWLIEGRFAGGKFDKGGVARIKLSKLDGRVLYLMHDR
jgi:NTF2 fold immunity protein